MTDDEPNGNGNNHLAVMAAATHKIWRLAVFTAIVGVVALLYFIWVSSTRADEVNDKDKVIATLTAENKALTKANTLLGENIEQLKVHVISLTAIIEQLTGAPAHTEVTSPPTTSPPVTTPATTVTPTTAQAMPDDSIHAGLPPDASNPHGG